MNKKMKKGLGVISSSFFNFGNIKYPMEWIFYEKNTVLGIVPPY